MFANLAGRVLQNSMDEYLKHYRKSSSNNNGGHETVALDNFSK